MEKKWYQDTDVMMGIAVVAVVSMLVIPIPAFLLDAFLAVSLMLSLLVLLTAMFNRHSNEFSVYPTMLLVTTVFRLALNVSSTRMILTEGPAFNSLMIRAFGEFVVGNNYVIGFIIFLILVLVQMMVITKGATRISEVSARFALDALPGKQMAIDTDLSNGILTEEEARKRREDLRQETDFYGRMDGATKFVQGDVRAGLVITAINIVGGLIIGMVMRGETFQGALQTYSLLTVGDGLVSQIPSLLITTATGMVVTRAGADAALGQQFSTQLFRNPKILWMVSGALIAAALIPGFPKIPFLGIGLLLAFLAFSITRSQEEIDKETQKQETQDTKSTAGDRFLDEIGIEPLKIEFGYNLIPLVDPSQGGQLLDRVTGLRKKFAREMGMIVPPIRITDNMEFKDGNEYAIMVGGSEVAKGRAFPERLAALDGGNVTEVMEGEKYSDPTYGLKAILIEPEKKAEAESKGYIVVDANNIIITHLSDILKTYATQIMGREEVKLLTEKMREKYPSLVGEVEKGLADSPGTLQSVLHNLLKENVSIRNMPAILETLADSIVRTKDAVLLTEYVRQRLGRQIAQSYSENDELHVIQVDPAIENELRNAITYDPQEGRIFTMDPHDQVMVRDSFVRAFNSAQSQGIFPVFIVSAEIRTGVFMILEREISPRSFAVLAYEELPNNVKLKTMAEVNIQQPQEESV